jgi:hypothetical protein
VNIVMAILFLQNFPIPRHQHGNRIREQEHSCSHGASRAVNARMPHPGVLQVDSVHQMMQSDVGIAATQPRQQRRQKPQKSVDRIPAKSTEEQIEPHHIGLQMADRLRQSKGSCGIVEGPATLNVETLQLGLSRGEFIGKNREAEKWITAQFFRDMKAVFAQSPLAGRKGRYQTNFHYSPASLSLFFG